MKPALFALACAAVLASAPVLSAEPDMHEPPGQRGPGPGMEGRRAHHGEHGLHGVKLSEAQQQKVFALRHAAEPVEFEQMGQLRKAHERLRELGQAPQFDEAAASSAANALGSATAALALSHARVAAQIHALLTPEQRAELANRPARPERGERGR